MNLNTFENQIKNIAIEEGIKSVLTEKSEEAREGGKAGFELCRDLETRDDFEKCLEERRKKEFEMADALNSGNLSKKRVLVS